jgi:hypothetical protein
MLSPVCPPALHLGRQLWHAQPRRHWEVRRDHEAPHKWQVRAPESLYISVGLRGLLELTSGQGARRTLLQEVAEVAVSPDPFPASVYPFQIAAVLFATGP